MTCAACSARVEKALNKEEGVNNAVVNLIGQKAVVEFDDTKTTPSNLIHIVEKKLDMKYH